MTSPVTTTLVSSAERMECLIVIIFFTMLLATIAHLYLDHIYIKARTIVYQTEADLRPAHMELFTIESELRSIAGIVRAAEQCLYEDRDRVRTQRCQDALGQTDKAVDDLYKMQESFLEKQKTSSYNYTRLQMKLGVCRSWEKTVETWKNAEASVLEYFLGFDIMGKRVDVK